MANDAAAAAPAVPPRFEVFEATTPAQKEQLYRFRYQVFTQEQHKYIQLADHERRLLVDELDEKAVHLCLAKDGEIIGSLRCLRGRQNATDAMRTNLSLDRFAAFADENFVFSGRLLMLPEHRGSRGLIHLLHANYRAARAAGGLFDFIFCNANLVRFYEMLGYRRYRPYYQDFNLGFQIPLVLIADDAEHLERIRSPFHALAKVMPRTPGTAAWFASEFPGHQAFVTAVAVGEEEFAQILSSRINDSEVGLFKGLDESEINDVVVSATHFHIDAGTKLVRRGDVGQAMFVVLDGVAEVRRARPNGDAGILLATLGKGSVFGEMSVLSSKLRSADVIAATRLEVVCIDQLTLKRFIGGKPQLASKLLFNLANTLVERLELAGDQIAEL